MGGQDGDPGTVTGAGYSVSISCGSAMCRAYVSLQDTQAGWGSPEQEGWEDGAWRSGGFL